MKNEKPNVLLLFTDQQRFDTIAAAGHDHMITPNLDRLVNEGALFTRAYTPNPVCIPARHHILTGLTARFHGYAANMRRPLDHRLPTLPRILRDAGYDTRAIGKMHFVPPRSHHGFAKMELMEEIPRFRQDDEYAMYLKAKGYGNVRNIHGVRNLLYMVPQRALVPEEHLGSTWVGDRSVEYLKSNGGARPFFLWSSWIAPHPPFNVPESYADLYRGRDIPAPYVSETSTSVRAKHGWFNADLPAGKEKEHIRRMRECYYAQISLVDKNVGKILRQLEEMGSLDDTLVIFTSDHGEMLGDHDTFQKQKPYDSAARIPFIVRYPKRFGSGERIEDFVDLNDILPTVLDAVGLEYPGAHALPGGSLFGSDKDRSLQYVESGYGPARFISMRDANHKYNYYYGGGREELFDMLEDPCESVNLLEARSSDQATVAAKDRLKRALVEHESRWGLENYVTPDGCLLKFDPLEVPTPDDHPKRNGQMPIFPGNLTDPEEIEELDDFGEEVIRSVSGESLVKLNELDLISWERNGAPKELIDRIKREGL